MATRLFDILVVLLIGTLLIATIALASHAWKILRTPSFSLPMTSLEGQELTHWIDLQIESAKQSVSQLDPGPPPPWYTPRYYYDWSPKAKLYGEAQDKLNQLQKQKRKILEFGKAKQEEAKAVWNFGISPLLHLFLAWSLLMISLRMILRLALVRQKFGWVQL
jgi:hypothetical protein